MENLTIGTDASIDECVNEGYGIIDYDPDELFDKDGNLIPYAEVRFYKYVPQYAIDGKYIKEGDLLCDTHITCNELWDIYQDLKKELDRFAFDSGIGFPKNVYEMLHLADVIDSYIGLP